MCLYLNAECAFNFLIQNNIFSNENWKNTHAETYKYDVSFDYENSSPKICCFEVVVINEKHCVLSNALKTTAIKFCFYHKIEKIFTDCAVNA